MTSTTSSHVTTTRRRDADAQSAFAALAETVRSEGLLRRRYGYYWARLIGLPALTLGLLAAFVWVGDTWWQLFLAAGFGILFAQVAFLGHDAAHRQVFASGRANDWASLVVGNLITGMSYGWWKHKHSRHHANPNKIGSDPDIDLPVVPTTPARVRAVRFPPLRWVLSHQGAFFFPVLLVEGVLLHASSVARLFARDRLERRAWEAAFLAIRLVGFPVLVFVVLSPGVAVVFLVVQLGVFGFYMGASFAPNHKGMPVIPATAKVDFLRRQAGTSRDITGGPWLDVLMGGLNYQIEHHLFPSMPRPSLRRASSLIRAYCLEHDVPYLAVSLPSSYRIVMRHIDRVGLGERDPFECPLLAQRATG